MNIMENEIFATRGDKKITYDILEYELSAIGKAHPNMEVNIKVKRPVFEEKNPTQDSIDCKIHPSTYEQDKYGGGILVHPLKSNFLKRRYDISKEIIVLYEEIVTIYDMKNRRNIWNLYDKGLYPGKLNEDAPSEIKQSA